ncbi:MAG: hypothetical protein HS113_29220 [Verrucomicrobiales bacterium]|nr:hypothetical protein [Verrucomicrobiales bacterium]
MKAQPMHDLMWWGYLHRNGSLQVKRWFGDHADYTTDCEGNDFVLAVVPPFPAPSRDDALTVIRTQLKRQLSGGPS